MKVVLFEVSLMNIILRISNDINWNVKVVSLEVSLMNFIIRLSNLDQLEGVSGVTRSIIDELHSSDIQRDQMEDGNGVT